MAPACVLAKYQDQMQALIQNSIVQLLKNEYFKAPPCIYFIRRCFIMKKKIFAVIACLTLIVMCLSGCKKHEDLQQPDSAGGEPPAAEPEKLDISGDRCVLIGCGGHTPVVLLCDEINQFVNKDIYYFDALAYMTDELVTRLDETGRFYTYDLESGKKQGDNSLYNLMNEKVKKDANITISANIEGEFMPGMRHVEYTADSQGELSGQYSDLIRQLMDQNGLENAKVNITDIWEYDLDGDNANEVFIKAQNTENESSYSMLALLSQSIESTLIAMDTGESAENFTLQPFVLDISPSGELKPCLISGGDYKRFELFDIIDGKLTSRYTVYFPLQ